MIVIGVLLVVIAAGAVALVLMAPDAMTNAIEVPAFGLVVNATPLALFVGGAISLALFALGFPMITQGIRRKAKRRKELHDLRKSQAAANANAPATGKPSSPRDHPQPESAHTGTAGATGTTGTTDSAGTMDSGSSAGTAGSAGTTGRTSSAGSSGT